MDVEAIRKKLGMRLTELRSAKGLRQEDFDRWGFSYRYYEKLERGIAKPTVETLARLCIIFDVTLSDLFLFIDDDKNASVEREQVAIKLAEILKDNRKARIKKLRVFLDDIL